MIYFVTNEQDNFDCLTSGKHTCFCRARAKNLGNLPKRLFGLMLVTVFLNSLPIPSSSTQASCYHELVKQDGSQLLLFPGVKDNKIARTSNDNLSTILDKMHLGYL